MADKNRINRTRQSKTVGIFFNRSDRLLPKRRSVEHTIVCRLPVRAFLLEGGN